MSYIGSLEDARAAIHSVEHSADIGHAKGKPGSKILHGSSSPGVHNKAASKTLPPPTKGKAGKGLRRKYAAS